MLSTMARNASERAGSWTKESYRSSDSIESSEDSDNSSTNGSLNGDKNRTNNHNHNNNANNHSNHSTSSLPHLPPPIGCITTHRVSAVIRPEIKAPPIDPLQFVKIQKNELSKTAVEQIKLAEEEKITKEKIKEVEEEWQNNLMSWKSKRKLTKNHSEDETLPRNPNRKTKTFSEILNEKAKSGARIGYNLHKYIDPDLENVNVDDVDVDLNINYLSVVSQTTTTTTEEYLSQTTNDNSSEISNDHIDNNNQPNMELNNNNNNNNEHNRSDDNVDHQQKQSKTNLDRFMETTNYNCMEMEKISRNGLGEIVVFNTSLLEEFSVKSDQQQQQHQHQCDKKINHTNDGEQQHKEKTQRQTTSPNIDINNDDNKKVHVPINDWKTSHPHSHHHHQSHDQLSPRNDDDTPYMQNSSFENDDDEDLDEELERLRIDQEKSFKAKLHTFEKLAKQEEEAAKRAAEANRKRQQNRIKLAAERSKSLSSINHSQTKNVLTASSSVSSSSLQNKNSNNNNNDNKSKHNNKPVNNNINKNNNNNEDQYYLTCKNPSTTSVVYNFKDKQEQNNINNNNNNNDVSNSNDQSQTTNITATNTKTMGQNSSHQQQQSSQISPAKKSQSLDESTINNNVEHKQQRDPVTSLNNIYENVTSIHQQQQQQQLSQPQLIQSNNIAGSTQQPILINQQNITVPSNEIIADPDAIRNASQKLIQQQQQIYQNQPPIQPVTTTSTSSPVNASIMHPPIVNNYPNDHYSNITSVHGNNGNFIPLHHHTISDDVGLPPVQITKSIQTPPISQHLSSDDLVNIQQQQQQHPVYQNQFFHNRENINETMIMPVRDDLVSFHEPKKPFIHYPHPSPSPSPQLIYPSNQTHINSSCIYTPKPFTAGNVNAQVMQPIPMQQMPILNNVPQRIPTTNRYGANGYNPNHWVIQEAELRQSTHRLQQQQQQPPQPSQQSQPIPPAPPLLPNKNGPGYLSVSGKKKCSKCGDELGKGCAAMVVESLSLYYHINCFRCSVCNVQLGNGTVGTDVRVRNNKLHCQNCYSNDEAGLKFSRV